MTELIEKMQNIMCESCTSCEANWCDGDDKAECQWMQKVADVGTVIEAEIRAKAIDEFAEKLKEILIGMKMRELRGEDVCPCAESGEECPYINQDVSCQYCAREHTLQNINEIAKQLKGERA